MAFLYFIKPGGTRPPASEIHYYDQPSLSENPRSAPANGASTGASFAVKYKVKHQMIDILNKAILYQQCTNTMLSSSKRFPEGEVKILPVYVLVWLPTYITHKK